MAVGAGRRQHDPRYFPVPDYGDSAHISQAARDADLEFSTSMPYIFLMADLAQIFEEEDVDARERAFAAARADLDAGNGVENDRVRAWLKELAAGRRTPPPCE